MRDLLFVTTLASAAFAGSVHAQTGNLVPLPPHGSTYVGFTRGFQFVAGSHFVIRDFELPMDSYVAGTTASVMVRQNGVIVLHSVGNVGPVVTPNQAIIVLPGDDVWIMGVWTPTSSANFTARNSFCPHAGTVIEGVPTQLYRCGWQWDIGDPGWANGQWLAPSTGLMTRTFVYASPPVGLFAGFDSDVEAGSSPLAVQFTDSSYSSDPGGVSSWAWDFDGDGVVDSTAQNPTHVYASCGSYDVTLTVTDATHPAESMTVVGAVVVDDIEASFTVANVGPGTWQFTDTSTPNASAWQWDFDGDGIVDDTSQNPLYVDPQTQAVLSLPRCTLTVTGDGGCFSDRLERDVVQLAGARASGPLVGGNGTSGTPAVGLYFDVDVLHPEGLRINGFETATFWFAGAFDIELYVREQTHVGSEGVPTAWTLAATGSGTATSSSSTVSAPEFVAVALDRPFLLPRGRYGVALFLVDPTGGTVGAAYTNGPAAAPYGNGDLRIHPAGVGCSSISLLGPCAYQPRLWNGTIYYETCSQWGHATAGTFATGCSNSAGVVPALTVLEPPRLGSDYELSLAPGLPTASAALLLFGDSRDVHNGLPLPLSLAAVGAPDCTLYTSVVESALLSAPPGGDVVWTFAIPNVSALQCFTFYQQAAVLDLGANALGFVFSNPTVASVGH